MGNWRRTEQSSCNSRQRQSPLLRFTRQGNRGNVFLTGSYESTVRRSLNTSGFPPHKPSNWPAISRSSPNKLRTSPNTCPKVFLKLQPLSTGHTSRAWPVGSTAEPTAWIPRPSTSLRSSRSPTYPQLSTRSPHGVAPVLRLRNLRLPQFRGKGRA